MKRVAPLALIAGLALATGIVAWYGFDEIGAALGRAGGRLLWLGPFHLLPLLLGCWAWLTLFPTERRPAFRLGIVASWIGISINWLLPVAQVGGEIAKAIWLARRGVPGGLAGASAVVDKTVQAATQALIALLGVGLLIIEFDGTRLVPAALGFSLVLLGLLYAFYRVQTGGFFSKLAESARFSARGATLMLLVGGAEQLDSGLREIHAAPMRVVASVLWRLLSRLTLAGEIWLALNFMGHRIGWMEALLLESLGQTVRAASFAIPGAYGVQEGGYVLLGGLVGLPPELGIAVSLAKRMRELVVGLPGLLVWQLSEGRSALRGRP
ncbi:MAG: lysylphosphatidylglycerol synthase domain-containing protein [Candidatus Acidoferrales bacterium]